MEQINQLAIDNEITVNRNLVFFEEPYGVSLKENLQNTVEISEVNWLNALILFLIHSNEKNNITTTIKDVIHFFDMSRIFYLQKNPVPQRYEVERIVIDLLFKLASEQRISFQNPI
jgi:hypothetical protein